MAAISKDALLYALDDIELIEDGDVDINELKDLIKRMPTIEAEPIKHGKWEIEEQMPFGVNVFAVRCSECGKEALVDGLEPIWRYCPKCGAIMDKV